MAKILRRNGLTALCLFALGFFIVPQILTSRNARQEGYVVNGGGAAGASGGIGSYFTGRGQREGTGEKVRLIQGYLSEDSHLVLRDGDVDAYAQLPESKLLEGIAGYSEFLSSLSLLFFP